MIRAHRHNFVIAVAFLTLCSSELMGAGFFGLSNNLSRGARWPLNPRTNSAGFERSLDGGLRYSVDTGSFETFRDSFNWSGTPPTVEVFAQTIQEAFDAWTAIDPATGLGTALYFVPDLDTPVVPNSSSRGAEIDLILHDFGSGSRRADARVTWSGFQTVLLTSGVNYQAQPINGADIRINNNPGASYSLNIFRTLLSHEIGHALGLRDVDVDAGPIGQFVDDNYDDSTSVTARETLTNSYAHLIDPYNPANSPLQYYTVANDDPGVDSLGVDILMESNIPGSLIGNLTPLSNDDYAARQFLYPQDIYAGHTRIAYTQFSEPDAGSSSFAPTNEDTELGFTTAFTNTGNDPKAEVSTSSSDMIISPILSHRSVDATTTFETVNLSHWKDVKLVFVAQVLDTTYENDDRLHIYVSNGIDVINIIELSTAEELNALTDERFLTYTTAIPDDWTEATLVFHSQSDSSAARERFDLDDIRFLGLPVDISPIIGDADMDGDVDFDDFQIWQANFGISTEAGQSDGDFNGDLVVDGFDLNLWQSHYGNTTIQSNLVPAPNSIPEPSSLIGLLLAYSIGRPFRIYRPDDRMCILDP